MRDQDPGPHRKRRRQALRILRSARDLGGARAVVACARPVSSGQPDRRPQRPPGRLVVVRRALLRLGDLLVDERERFVRPPFHEQVSGLERPQPTADVSGSGALGAPAKLIQ